ncbi:MAG: hypothetical protein NVSMB3_05970 [Acidobacteriaceae bacterium]
MTPDSRLVCKPEWFLMRSTPHSLIAAAAVCLTLLSSSALSQSTKDPAPEGNTSPLPDAPAAAATAPAVFRHPQSARYLISGQANIILQAHAPFHSPYQGVNSTLSRGEYKTSLLGTLYLGAQIRRAPRTSTDLILDIESSGGRGISEALGLAGFTNLDVVRNPTLGSKPYIARIQLHQTVGLTRKLAEVDRSQFSLSTQAPERRLEFHVGRMSLPDFLDLNSSGSDSHLQFMNWTTDNNGAWDYAADTRGYTYAAVAEYIDRKWSARYALALMPTVANGVKLQWNLRRANGQNVEIELRHPLLGPLLPAGRKGTVRLLGYVNHANMGVYRRSNRDFSLGITRTPDITAHPPATTVKYGFGLNFEQELAPDLNTFGRFGWNEGQHESFAYTEVDQTFQLGADLSGRRWSRPNDKLGLVVVTNAIKRDHQSYLALGGLGFLVGDGRLHYAREDIVESYYTLHTWRGLYYALDAQFIEHPGYNADRGPVLVESVRMHVDF